MNTVTVNTEQLRADFLAMEAAPPLSQDAPSFLQADVHLLTLDDAGRPVARCSLWYTSVPSHPDHALGFVGHYASRNDAAAAALLERCDGILASRGCTLAVGPIDGSTFRNYRFVTHRAVNGVERPIYFLEPDNPDAWPRQLKLAGYSPAAEYMSAFGELPEHDSRLAALQSKAQALGVTIRNANLDEFELELERIYNIVIASFQDNFLYSPISRQEFVSQYSPIRPFVRPELVLIAEQSAIPVGFAFTLPDMAQQQRGHVIDTLIIKTVAVLPELGGHGLGSLLTSRAHAAAYALGFRYVIHALLHETNVSTYISKRYAAPFRRYTLFSKRINA